MPSRLALWRIQIALDLVAGAILASLHVTSGAGAALTALQSTLVIIPSVPLTTGG